ncbi:hypothetical protein AVEN_101980-1 [Araneus ventricosus]|uniref:Uncharacterized protein n=1 Tax=Araneus ventricosus TaxID=182803 RepID=A0A4Y2WQM4_ARAVE|nr:hypothetical protein AVEN_101980-1 [Araneus ventricosus]
MPRSTQEGDQLTLVPTTCGLAKPRVARGSYLSPVVVRIRTNAPFLRCVTWQTDGLTPHGHFFLLCYLRYLPPQRGKPQMYLQAHERHRFFPFRRQEITRTSDETREKTGR